MHPKYLLNTGVHDCLICALRPLIYLGFSSSYIAKAECRHRENVKRPSFQPNRYITLCSIFCNSFLLIGFSLTIRALCDSRGRNLKFAYDNAVLGLKFINTTIFTLSLYVYNDTYFTFTNGLVTLIEKRKLFGIDTILSRVVTSRLRLFTFMFLCICSIYLLQFFYESISHEFSIENILRTMGTTVMYLNTVVIFGHIVIIVFVYSIILRTCYTTIEETLENALSREKNIDLVTVDLREKIQHLQRFYLAVCGNYDKHVFAFGNVLYYISQFVFSVLQGVHFYLYYYYVEKDFVKHLLLRDTIIIDNFFVLIGMLTYCVIAYQITHASEDLLSFLYKYPLCKLNRAEAAQVDILIMTLTLCKPELSAANLFTIGLNLIPSVLGTVITYFLVALQFHA